MTKRLSLTLLALAVVGMSALSRQMVKRIVHISSLEDQVLGFKTKKMRELFFDGAPSELPVTLRKLQKNAALFRSALKQKFTEYDLIIGHANRPSHVGLVKAGLLPIFDYYFCGSNAGCESVSMNWITAEKELELGYQAPLVWGVQQVWDKLEEFFESNKDKKILFIPSYLKARHDDLLKKYPNVTATCVPGKIADTFGGDKRDMANIYQAIGLSYDVCNFDSADAIDQNWMYFVGKFQSQNLVVQATVSAGGLTNNCKRSVHFVSSESQFNTALAYLAGEGPVRVMKKYEGIPSNTSGLALPFGVYVSSIPSVKPCGLGAVNGLGGTGSGNQWDMRYSVENIQSQNDQLIKVGQYMALNDYVAVFGLDPIMSLLPDYVFNSEINGRSQGPDAQRGKAALQAGILTLEEMQIAYYLKLEQELFPSSEEYNMITRWLKIPAYIKLFADNDFKARVDMNGYWSFDAGVLRPAKPNNALFEIAGAPKQGQVSLVSNPMNLLYIELNDANFKVFTEGCEPDLTPDALEVVNAVYQMIGHAG